jgi:ABC-type transporter MlaC component
MMQKFATVTVLFFCLALVVACASDKGPAEVAIKAAEEAVNAVKAEAAKYVPDQLKKVEDASRRRRITSVRESTRQPSTAPRTLPARRKTLQPLQQQRKRSSRSPGTS